MRVLMRPALERVCIQVGAVADNGPGDWLLSSSSLPSSLPSPSSQSSASLSWCLRATCFLGFPLLLRVFHLQPTHAPDTSRCLIDLVCCRTSRSENLTQRQACVLSACRSFLRSSTFVRLARFMKLTSSGQPTSLMWYF